MTLDTVAKVKAIFGEPIKVVTDKNTVDLFFPYPMYYDGKLVKKTKVHPKLKDRFLSVFTKVLEVYGLEKIKELGLDQYGGCHNYRVMRGGTELSRHSWAIAMDFDPANNQLKWNHRKARFAKPEYDQWWNIWEEFGFESLGREEDRDWMHVQAAR